MCISLSATSASFISPGMGMASLAAAYFATALFDFAQHNNIASLHSIASIFYKACGYIVLSGYAFQYSGRCKWLYNIFVFALSSFRHSVIIAYHLVPSLPKKTSQHFLPLRFSHISLLFLYCSGYFSLTARPLSLLHIIAWAELIFLFPSIFWRAIMLTSTLAAANTLRARTRVAHPSLFSRPFSPDALIDCSIKVFR